MKEPTRSVAFWLTAARVELRVQQIKWRSRGKRKEAGSTLEQRVSSWLLSQLPTEEAGDLDGERSPALVADSVVAAALWADSARQIGVQMLVQAANQATQLVSGAYEGSLTAPLSGQRVSEAATQSAVRVAMWHAQVWMTLMKIAAAKIVQISLLRTARQADGMGDNKWPAWAERRVLLAANRVLTQGKNDDETVGAGVPELKRLLTTPPKELVAAGVLAALLRPHAVLRFYTWFFPWTMGQAFWQVSTFLLSFNAVPASVMLAGSVAVGAGSSLQAKVKQKAALGVSGLAKRMRSAL